MYFMPTIKIKPMEIYDELGSYIENNSHGISSYECPYMVAPLNTISEPSVKISKNLSDICWQDVVFFIISIGVIFYSLINVLRLM